MVDLLGLYGPVPNPIALVSLLFSHDASRKGVKGGLLLNNICRYICITYIRDIDMLRELIFIRFHCIEEIKALTALLHCAT